MTWVNKLTGRSVVLFKTFNPLSDWYGLLPIEAAAYSIDQHNQAGAWNQAILQNGARPSGAIVIKSTKDGSSGNLSQGQYQRLKEQINDHCSGSVNAGRPILLEGGLEWKEMSLTPRDMDFPSIAQPAILRWLLAFHRSCLAYQVITLTTI
ncbi:MAG: hypothetical protein PG980_000505 [Wolbachia endosymbiont of Ctenocephalides felis wCfeJ]|nr:MAG: hypothetical protein PG980_000505 [Wolbachia endosymbiont of Ctenocephalides felis wCfeJ]